MDWKPIIVYLEAAGLSQRQIADECGMEHASLVSNLKNGVQKTCSYEIGCKLMDLHRQVERKTKRAAVRAGQR